MLNDSQDSQISPPFGPITLRQQLKLDQQIYGFSATKNGQRVSPAALTDGAEAVVWVDEVMPDLSDEKMRDLYERVGPLLRRQNRDRLWIMSTADEEAPPESA